MEQKDPDYTHRKRTSKYIIYLVKLNTSCSILLHPVSFSMLIPPLPPSLQKDCRIDWEPINLAGRVQAPLAQALFCDMLSCSEVEKSTRERKSTVFFTLDFHTDCIQQNECNPLELWS